jgi:DNA-binding MarR family transcriptional regulator
MAIMRTTTDETGTGDPPWGDGPLPATLTRRTGFLLSTLGRRCTAAAERVLAPLGIKPHHYGVLVVLEAAGVATQHAVGERLGIDKSTMTVVGDFLEGRGLVERRRNPVNRRAYELTLTEAGRDVLARAEPLIAAAQAELLDPLDASERAELHALLVRLLPIGAIFPAERS